MAARSARCSSASSRTVSGHDWPSAANQLRPSIGKRLRGPPVIRRRTSCFQYAACSTTSRMLCRPGAGRQAACAGVTPATARRSVGPCQALPSKASSIMERSSVRGDAGM